LRTCALVFTSENRCTSNKLCNQFLKTHCHCWCHYSNQDCNQACQIPITITHREDIFLNYSRIFVLVCEMTFHSNVLYFPLLPCVVQKSLPVLVPLIIFDVLCWVVLCLTTLVKIHGRGLDVEMRYNIKMDLT